MNSNQSNNLKIEENNEREEVQNQNTQSDKISCDETAVTICENSSENSMFFEIVKNIPKDNKSFNEVENIFKNKKREHEVFSKKIAQQGVTFEISTWNYLKSNLESNSNIYIQILEGGKHFLTNEHKIVYKKLYTENFAPFILELLESKIAIILLKYLKGVKNSWKKIFNSEYPDKINQEEYVLSKYPDVSELKKKIKKIKSSIKTYTPLEKEFKDEVLNILDHFNKEESPLERYFQQKFDELHILDNYITEVSCARSDIKLENIQSPFPKDIYNILIEDDFFKMSYDLTKFEADLLFLVVSTEEQSEASNKLQYLNSKGSFNFKYGTPCIIIMESTVSPTLSEGTKKLKQSAKNSLITYLFLQDPYLYKLLKLKYHEVEKFKMLAQNKKFILPLYITDITEFNSIEDFYNVYFSFQNENKYINRILNTIAINIEIDYKITNEETVKKNVLQQFVQYPISLYSLEQKTKKNMKYLKNKLNQVVKKLDDLTKSNKALKKEIADNNTENIKKFDEMTLSIKTLKESNEALTLSNTTLKESNEDLTKSNLLMIAKLDELLNQNKKE